MWLFGRKKAKQNGSFLAGVNAYYYDGQLQGMSVNDLAFVALTEEALVIFKGKAPLTITLEPARVTGLEVFTEESAYLRRYHGDSAGAMNPASLLGDVAKRAYFVIHYTSADGIAQQFDFWCLALDAPKVLAIKEKLSCSTGEHPRQR